MANISSRLETSTQLVLDLIKDVEKGQIKIPQFQRRFLWSEGQAIELLDSIANNYPIGSLLLWRTDSKLVVERNIGDFRLPETGDFFPTDYVLDGQQRLTVIYSCLGSLPEGDGFEAAYDLKRKVFVQRAPDAEPYVVPLRYMFKTSKLLDFRTQLREIQDDSTTVEALDEVIHIFTNYRVPVVLLKDLTVEEVCPIFERINSSGTRLSTYDLMVAATWTRSFDLNEKTSEIQSALQDKKFDDIEGDTILKCLSAVQFGSVKRSDLFALRTVKGITIDTVVARTREALLKAVDTLSTEFLVYSWDFLPYEAILVVLAYLYDKHPTFDADQTRRLRQWFWRAAASERYRVGGEAFVTQDLRAVLEFVHEGNGDPTSFGGPIPASLWKQTAFRSNNSRSRAFILALAQLHPRNLTNGSTIEIDEALSRWNRKEFHHVHPRAFLKRTGAPGEHNAIANICMLAASENKAVLDRDPKEYLPACASALKRDADKVFRSNLLPEPTQFKYPVVDFTAFLDRRSDLIAELFVKLCNGDKVAM